MKPARILLLVVAIFAGGLAAFLATRGQAPAPTVEQPQTIEEAKVQVLVAARAIGIGERLSPDTVVWQDWPEGALRPEYVTSEVVPDAREQMTGTVARFEIFTGEPIRASKLIRSEQGYLSAAIPQGKRAVSIPVTAASGAGGFIVPNDHVDIVQTIDEGAGPLSTTILTNVKVLAIGQRLGQIGATGGEAEGQDEAGSETFVDETIATMELDPFQSEAIIAAEANGPLTLVLRSVLDFNQTSPEVRTGSNQSITVIRSGNAMTVQSNSTPDMAFEIAQPDPATAALDAVTQPLFEKAGLNGEVETASAAAPAPARQ